MNPLPPEAIAAIQRRDVIQAIKLVREQYGLGLKEARDAVESYRLGNPTPIDAEPLPGKYGGDFSGMSGGMPPAAIAALARGEKLEAVRLVREATGLGLAQAKDLVDAHVAAKSPARARPGQGPGQGFEQGSVAQGMDHLIHDAMAEPGRVNASRWGSPTVWLVVAVVAGLAWLYLDGKL